MLTDSIHTVQDVPPALFCNRARAKEGSRPSYQASPWSKALPGKTAGINSFLVLKR